MIEKQDVVQTPDLKRIETLWRLGGYFLSGLDISWRIPKMSSDRKGVGESLGILTPKINL